jgi:hypothetical protein
MRDINKNKDNSSKSSKKKTTKKKDILNNNNNNNKNITEFFQENKEGDEITYRVGGN